MARHPTTVYLLALALTGSTACNSMVSGPVGNYDPGQVDGSLACTAPEVAQQPLRRLSRTQYLNTIRDLVGGELGAELIASSTFPPTVVSHGFSSNADANVVGSQTALSIEENAESLAALVLSDSDAALSQLMPCAETAGTPETAIDGCIDDFVTDFGRRAFRRPLTTAEHALVSGIYDAVRPQGALTAWGAVLQYFFQAPALLYMTERGVWSAPGSGLVHLNDFELATRLSYMVTNTTPDNTLLDLAEDGQLQDPEVIKAQAERLMASPAFLAASGLFHREWLDIRNIPNATGSLRDSLLAEPGQLFASLLDADNAFVYTLLSTPDIPLNADLEGTYGVSGESAGSDDWVVREVQERSGLLTLAGFARSHSNGVSTSPIERGAFIRENILCSELPPLPSEVDIATAFESTAGEPTARDRIAPTSQRAECRSCHRFINPPGLALETFDAQGRHRSTENDVAIDTSGELVGSGTETDGAFADTKDLLDRLARSERVADCYASKWLESALGRILYDEDACTLESIHEQFAASGGDIKELVVSIAQSDAFRLRTHPLSSSDESEL